MLDHLRGRGLHVARSVDVSAIPIIKPTSSASLDDKMSTNLAYLLKRGAQRSASIKTLTGSVSSLFQPKLGNEEVASLLAELQRGGAFSINGTKVIYSLPD